MVVTSIPLGKLVAGLCGDARRLIALVIVGNPRRVREGQQIRQRHLGSLGEIRAVGNARRYSP